ncbi:MAG: hypothetical protein WAZ96_05560, partial [Candidatus Moraniibacteriota bacterium]
MICTNFSPPSYFIFSSDVPALLYYSHIPTAIITLLLGVFVFWGNKNLLSKILLSLSVTFSLWLFINLITWTNINSDIIMFVYPLFGILIPIIYILCLYFVYVFIDKKDINFRLKLFLGLILSFATVFSYKNATGFDLVNCEAIEGGWYSIHFLFGLELFFSLWILVYGIYKYAKEKTGFKKQILLLITGIELFLFSFFFTGFLASYLAKKAIIDVDYSIEFYGLFGMTFFMGVLAFMIVKFKTFHIKLLGVQALVVTLVVLIGSQFAFIRNNTNK